MHVKSLDIILIYNIKKNKTSVVTLSNPTINGFVIQFHCTCAITKAFYTIVATKELKPLNSEWNNAFVSAQGHTLSNSA